MTPAQTLAFRYPLTHPAHLHLNAVVNLETGELRGPPSDPVDKRGRPISPKDWTAEQRAAATLGPQDKFVMGILSYLENLPNGPWRVTLIVDATGTTAEHWPAWHATVTHAGELRSRRRMAAGNSRLTPLVPRGLIHENAGQPTGIEVQALPMAKWNWQHKMVAHGILKRALAEVSADEYPVVIATVEETLRASAKAMQQAIGLSARRLMSPEEAEQCFRNRPEVLARLNPAWGALHLPKGA